MSSAWASAASRCRIDRTNSPPPRRPSSGSGPYLRARHQWYTAAAFAIAAFVARAGGRASARPWFRSTLIESNSGTKHHSDHVCSTSCGMGPAASAASRQAASTPPGASSARSRSCHSSPARMALSCWRYGGQMSKARRSVSSRSGTVCSAAVRPSLPPHGPSLADEAFPTHSPAAVPSRAPAGGASRDGWGQRLGAKRPWRKAWPERSVRSMSVARAYTRRASYLRQCQNCQTPPAPRAQAPHLGQSGRRTCRPAARRTGSGSVPPAAGAAPRRAPSGRPAARPASAPAAAR